MLLQGRAGEFFRFFHFQEVFKVCSEMPLVSVAQDQAIIEIEYSDFTDVLFQT